MAITTAIFVCILAGVNAGYVWVNDGEAGYSNSPFPSFRMPQPMFGPNFPFDFVFSHVPFPRIPSVEEMKNTKPGPNQIYNGVAVRSSSSMVRDKDGKLVPTGGTSILVNENGQVREEKIGQNPPKLDDPIIIPMMPRNPPIPPMPPMPPMPTMPDFSVPKVPPLKMPSIKVPPIKVPPMSSINLKSYIPGANEQFVGVSTSSFSSSSDINGVKKEAGGTNTLVNVNGAVDEKGLEYMKNDIPN